MAKAIEDGFPIKVISQLAQRESWRKEVYRPIYYIHKWWARRLGSVFRAIILACCAEDDEDIEYLFYQPVRFPDTVVYDPFMGSGTTVGEALKLGCRVIGRDINPVSVGMVTVAMEEYSRREVEQAYQELEASVAREILSFYRGNLSTGKQADVLYYFWVKIVPCPYCDHQVELFKSRIFAKHAYPKRHPEAKSVCPGCGCISDVKYDDESVTCPCCAIVYNPQIGAVKGSTVTCPVCHQRFKTIDAVQRTGLPPSHKLYAKMVLTEEGKKEYLPPDEQDLRSYRRAEEALPRLWTYVPQNPIMPGYNTNQVLNYNYKYWHQMFNARQLVSASLLAREIRDIADPRLQMLFAFLLSGVLEFNNMFCSFKGEGTGAVRHMFSHHILKPELMPIEANLWGTPKSSGAFSTLFRSRILRALDYKEHPFELKLVQNRDTVRSSKVFGLSCPIQKAIARTYREFSQNRSVYLSCGDSSDTHIPDGSVDLIITDPPFFDNVHYSQLADFFHAWLSVMLEGHKDFATASTRSVSEVQDTEAEGFARKLTAVFRECHRVLRNSGLLVFTYHHSRVEGWISLYRAIREAGFCITRIQPVKAEMAVSVPLQQSKSPVGVDLIFVCRKAQSARPEFEEADGISLLSCLRETKTSVLDLKSGGIAIGIGDVKVILMGSILSRLAALGNLSAELSAIREMEWQVDALAEKISLEVDSTTAHSAIDDVQQGGTSYQPRDVPVYQQLSLLLEELAKYDV